MMASITLTLRRPQTLLRLVYRPSEERLKPHDHTPDASPPTRLLSFNNLPPWYQDNPYIRTAYRPVSYSFRACIASLSYLHNETLNIYTHLLPALFILSLFIPPISSILSPYHPTPSPLDAAIFHANLLAAFTTFSLSATYHTCMSHSPHVSNLCLRFDYAGILLLILASFLSGIHVGFYCVPHLKHAYWGMISVLSAVTAVFVLNPRLQGVKYRGPRTIAFVATALSGLAPIAHGIVLYGWPAMWERSGMRYWLSEGVCYGVGAGVFGWRVPERWVCGWNRRNEEREGKGKGEEVEVGRWVDVVGCSHQIFHVCVVIGAAVHVMGVWDAWGWVGRGQGLGGCVS